MLTVVARLTVLVCIVHDDSHARMVLCVILGVGGAKPRVVSGQISVLLLRHMRLTGWAVLLLVEHVTGDLASWDDWWRGRCPLLAMLHRSWMLGP